MRFILNKLLIILFFISFPLFARDVNIFVKDSDLNLPLEGAVVRTREGTQYITDKDGRAVIETPDNRQIIINASYPGYETGVLAIPVTGGTFTVMLNLSGIMLGRELVVEVPKQGSSETRTGRSIAVSEKEIAQTGEIGIIEDVMSTIKLLPGVGYGGFLDAEPSIRGGHPGDMSASLNGFYINNPYFWGGTFSIFDPRTVQSAQLSHGVFSSRYGHTISGLLEVTSKAPSPTETQFEISLNTSAANMNLSIPFNKKGGILITGRITYYDPVLALAGKLSELSPRLEILGMVKAFGPAPHIRATSINANYRISDKLDFSAVGFFGLDAVGISFNNQSYVNNFLNSESTIDFLFKNYQGFLTANFSYNPRSNMLLKFLAGVGYEDQTINGDINYYIANRSFSTKFQEIYPFIYNIIPTEKRTYSFEDNGHIDQSESNLNLQARIDYDWEINNKLLFSAGVQTMFNIFKTKGIQKTSVERRFDRLNKSDTELELQKQIRDQIYIQIWNQVKTQYPYQPDAFIKSIVDPLVEQIVSQMIVSTVINQNLEPSNKLLSTSGYILAEYSPINKINAELGLRIDHFYLSGGNDMKLNTIPVFNPRFNIDFNLYNGHRFFENIDLSIGTGLFSSMNDNVFFAENNYNIEKLKPNRSWTSVIGFKFDFPKSISLNIEGYFKYVFDRMYILMSTGVEDYSIEPKFDGEGIVGGIDVMLQKLQSRYWDGWIAYSFSWAKYKDPQGRVGGSGMSGGTRGDDWYFPTFHRFHTLNLIMNVKPVQKINLYFRLGLASGVPLSKRSDEGPISMPVYMAKDNQFIEKYYWFSEIDEKNRTTVSLNLDFKLSIFGASRKGKARYEIYFAIENILGLLYAAEGNKSYNQYTGEIEDGTFSATYDMPIPIPSFGFKYSY